MKRCWTSTKRIFLCVLRYFSPVNVRKSTTLPTIWIISSFWSSGISALVPKGKIINKRYCWICKKSVDVSVLFTSSEQLIVPYILYVTCDKLPQDCQILLRKSQHLFTCLKKFRNSWRLFFFLSVLWQEFVLYNSMCNWQLIMT